MGVAVPLPPSTWVPSAQPTAGQVLAQSDPAGIDFGVDVSWRPADEAAASVRSYQVELFSGANPAQSNSLIGRVEVDASVTSHRFEAAAFGRVASDGDLSRSTVIARVTPVDGAARLTPLVSNRLTLPATSAGTLSDATAGTPVLTSPTADGFTATWQPAPAGDPTTSSTPTAAGDVTTPSAATTATPAAPATPSAATTAAPATPSAATTTAPVAPTLAAPSATVTHAATAPAAPTDTDPAPAGYVLRVFERLHSMSSPTANSFVVTTLDAGNSTGAVVEGLHGSSRYVASVVAYDLVDGQKRFRAASVVSDAPTWAEPYAAETTGTRTPPVDWSVKPAAPVAESARSVTWKGTAAQFDGGAAVTGYRVQLHRSGTGLVQSTDVPAPGSGSPSATFRALDPDTSYSVRVAAINAAGVGEFSDYSAVARTPSGSTPGSRPPAYADRSAIERALTDGTVASSTARYTVEQGDDLTLALPWGGSQSGELWWYGSRTFAAAVSTAGVMDATTAAAASAAPGATTTTVPTTALAVGDHWALFVTDDELDGVEPHERAVAVKVSVVPSTAGILKLDDAVLRWGLNDESNNGAYAGGCNFLSAGRSPDPGGSIVFTENYYSPASGTVSIQKPDATGGYVAASWATRCLDRTGAPLSSGTSTPYGGNQFVMTGGTGEVDRSTGGASIRWQGDVTVAYYGGMTFWYLSDPVLTVVDGTGTLTATVGGFGTDMENLAKWQPITERSVTLAVLRGVQVGPEGFTVTPDYRGVAVALPAGQTQQVRSGENWGAFPQDFVDFQTETGQAAYWFSSGGQADAAKVAAPLTVGYDAASFSPPVASAQSGDKPAARVPVVKKPPVRGALAPFSLEAVSSGASTASAAAASSVVIVETQAVAPLSRAEIVLLILLMAALGVLLVVSSVGGGIVTLAAGRKK
jgi:hypothetical protein